MSIQLDDKQTCHRSCHVLDQEGGGERERERERLKYAVRCEVIKVMNVRTSVF
jgi:hypothetical protein